MPAQTGIDRNMQVQEKIRRRKAGGYGGVYKGASLQPGQVTPKSIAPPQQNARAFGTAAAAAQRSAQGRESHQAPTGNPSVGQAVNTAIGAQLQRRVKSGAIDDQQAKRVAGERSLLEAKFGPDFREKAFGGTGAFQKARSQVAANPDSERLQNVLDKLKSKRKTAVNQARRSRDRGSYDRFKQGASEGQ